MVANYMKQVPERGRQRGRRTLCQLTIGVSGTKTKGGDSSPVPYKG
jgi:hypothetical protein